MEVPCIVSNINGCNEIIQDGESGALVPPKQVQPLIEKMKNFFHQKEHRKIYAKKAKQFVQTHFEREQFWNYLLEEYKQQEQHVSIH